MSSAVAEDQGLMPVTERAVENRKAHRVTGEVIAHYQLLNSREAGRDVFWVESYGKAGEFESGYLVEIVSEDGHLWASCGREWFLKYRKSTTVCKHILAGVLMHRKRG